MSRRKRTATMGRTGIWSGTFGVGVLTLALLVSMVEVGARAPGYRALSPLSEPGLLDYSAPPVGGFTPLEDAYVREALGERTTLLASSYFGPEPASQHPPLDLGALVIEHALTNDTVGSAYLVPRVPFVARTNAAGSTREASDPENCAQFGSTIWYRYVAPSNAAITARIDSGAPAAIGAFTASGSTLSAIACDEDPQGQARVTVPLIEGEVYLFQVTLQVAGPVVFSIDPTSTVVPVSLTSRGRFASTASWMPLIAASGRYVVFQAASPLGQVKHNTGQVYARDILTRETELVSLTWDSRVPNSDSRFPSVSDDGRFVLWYSEATNVVPEDTTSDVDSFLRDRRLGTTELVSIDENDDRNPQGWRPTMTPDGRYVSFMSGHGSNFRHWVGYIRDRVRGVTMLATATHDGRVPDEGGGVGVMTPDGRLALFHTSATDIKPGSIGPHQYSIKAGIDGGGQIYVRDMITGEITTECMNERGEPANDRCWGGALSANGRYSVFWSPATNLVEGLPGAPPGTGVAMYTYVRDRLTGKLEVVNLNARGEPQPEIWRRQLGVSRVGTIQGEEWSIRVSISADGRFVGFEGKARLVAGDNIDTLDAFVRDRDKDRTIWLSEAPGGGPATLGPQGNVHDNTGPPGSMWAYLSADASVVAFQSSATNLVEGDDNSSMDVFVRFLGKQ